MTVGEEGRLGFMLGTSCMTAFADREGGVLAVGLEEVEDGDVGTEAGRGKGAGEPVSLGEGEEEMVETVLVGGWVWTGLSGGIVIEEVTVEVGGDGTVFTMATVGEAPPTAKTSKQTNKQTHKL